MEPVRKFNTMMDARISFLRPATLAVVTVCGPYAVSGPKAWAGMFEWLDRSMHHKTTGRGYGMMYGDPRQVAENDLKYIAAVEVPETWLQCDSKLISLQKFEGGAYASLRCVGPYDDVAHRIAEFRDGWVPNNRLFLDKSKPILTLFFSDPRHVAPRNQIAHLCLPIIPDRRAHDRTADAQILAADL